MPRPHLVGLGREKEVLWLKVAVADVVLVVHVLDCPAMERGHRSDILLLVYWWSCLGIYNIDTIKLRKPRYLRQYVLPLPLHSRHEARVL